MIKARNGTKQLYLYRRVPKRFASVEPRKFVWVSLHTDSPTVAEVKAAGTWQQMVEGWEALRAGDTADAEGRFAAARELAAVRGFRYLSAPAVAKLPVEELLKRVEAVPSRKERLNPLEAVALLGGAPDPQITISRALEIYWTLAKDKTIGKSADQLRRWKNPRIKAVKNLIAVIGDKPLSEITGDDMLEFRQWWIEKVETAGVTANSANKDLIHIGSVFKTVNRLKRLGLVLPLSDLKIAETDAKKRPPFSVEWIKEKLLAPGKLDGLNPEAKAILLVMVNTGCRPSELAALSSNTIRLNANVPHIAIEPEERQVKSKHAIRIVPLLGISLEAMRAFPQGFPRYRQNSASLSATVNKFLRENDLLETEEHTLYSLRHSFEDRMLAAGIDDRIRRDLFGHRLTRERYGNGASLEQKAEVLQPVAL